MDSRNLNEATIKRKAQMPNMEELISRISRKISEEQEGEIWLTKLDFDYAYGQIKLDDQTKNLCIFTVTGGEFTGYYRFLKGFYGLADIPTVFQERIDKTLEFKHPARLDDIIIVTKGTVEKHETNKRNNEKTGRSWIQATPKEMRILQKGSGMGRTQNRPRRNLTATRQIRSNHEDTNTQKRKRIKIIFGGNTILIKIHQEPVSTNRYTQKTFEEIKRVDLDRRTYGSIQ